MDISILEYKIKFGPNRETVKDSTSDEIKMKMVEFRASLDLLFQEFSNSLRISKSKVIYDPAEQQGENKNPRMLLIDFMVSSNISFDITEKMLSMDTPDGCDFTVNDVLFSKSD